MSLRDRIGGDTAAFITHDPTREDTRPFHQVHGDRTHLPGLILNRAYTLAQQGQWDRMRAYLAWELDQPVHGDPAMDQVRELHYTVRNVDSIDQLTRTYMTSAMIRYSAGYTDLAIARLGWLLELIPTDHHLHSQVATLAATFIHETEHP